MSTLEIIVAFAARGTCCCAAIAVRHSGVPHARGAVRHGGGHRRSAAPATAATASCAHQRGMALIIGVAWLTVESAVIAGPGALR